MISSGTPDTGIKPAAWILAVVAALLYIPFIGGVHLFDWDEINFAEISREMIMTGDYLRIRIDYEPFFEKPPFFFWLQVLSMKIFGINEFAARFPNAMAGILVPVLLFRLGSYWMDRRFGWFWALSYMGSLLPALYHKSGIIDPWFNLFIFSSIAAWVEGSRTSATRKYFWYVASGLLSGLAVLTKGPVGALLIGLTLLIMRMISKDKKYLEGSAIMLFLMGNVLIAGAWFGINWITNGPEFILAFLQYQEELLTKSVAGHKGFPGYHFIVTLFGVFPASIFAIGALRPGQKSTVSAHQELRVLMIILLAIVLILFSVVQSKIVHYSSLVYYPVSFLSAWAICRYLDGTYSWPRWQVALGWFMFSILLLAVIFLPVAGMNLAYLKENLKFDAFTRATLDAEVQWGLIDFLPAVTLVLMAGLSMLWLKQKRFGISLLSLFIGMGLFVNVGLIFFIKKIEHYSQRAAIDFCKEQQGKFVEVKTLGFKSYIPYFYTTKKKMYETSCAGIPALYIIKANKKEEMLLDYPGLKIMYEKNGYIFLEPRE